MKNKILFALSLLLGLLFINSGLNKIFEYMPLPDDMPVKAMKMFLALQSLKWLMPVLAVAEIVGGLLIILPKLRALGALVLTPVMVGILAHHIVLGDNMIMQVVMAGVLTWIIVENKEKYLPLIK